MPCGTAELGRGSTETARSPLCQGGCGASLLPSSARDSPAPSRLFTGISRVAALALLIHGGLHSPKTPCFPGAVASWAGLVRSPCVLLLVAQGELLARHRFPGILGEGRGPPSRDQTSVEAPGGCVHVHACPCEGTCVPQLGHMCWTRGAGVPDRVHPHPTRGPLPTPALGHFLLRQNCWFFLLINLTHNLMLGSDFPLPHPGDGLTPPTP